MVNAASGATTVLERTHVSQIMPWKFPLGKGGERD